MHLMKEFKILRLLNKAYFSISKQISFELVSSFANSAITSSNVNILVDCK